MSVTAALGIQCLSQPPRSLNRHSAHTFDTATDLQGKGPMTTAALEERASPPDEHPLPDVDMLSSLADGVSGSLEDHRSSHTVFENTQSSHPQWRTFEKHNQTQTL